MPVLPGSVMGIAVTLHLGFKSKSTYDRWWEARTEYGALQLYSRVWAIQVMGLVHHAHADVAAIQKDLIYRQIAIVYATICLMRSTSHLPLARRRRLFEGRRAVDAKSVLLSVPEIYEPFLSTEECGGARTRRNTPLFLLTRQAGILREMVTRGGINLTEELVMLRTLNEIEAAQARCERIKNTPFSRQISCFGPIFTLIFVLLVPLALLDALVQEAIAHGLRPMMTHEFFTTLMLLSIVVSWVFIMMEKISNSTEEPFEGGAHDVPVSALSRAMEIELREALGETELPPPLAPIDNVLY